MKISRTQLGDGLFVAALMVYVLVGIAAAPVHGDEFMQVAMSRDVFYLAHGQMDAIRYAPPVQPDTEQQLRLLNGPLNKDLIGIALMFSGRTEQQLPGIFAWAMPMDWNQQQGNVPDPSSLNVARIPSALFTAFAVLAIFIVGFMVGRRAMAYTAALLFALDPVILLNGRRAMMEGGLLFFTLVMVGLAIWIARSRRVTWVSLTLLGVMGALTLAAKHTGVWIVAAVFVAVLWTQWGGAVVAGVRGKLLGGLVYAAALTGLVFFVLNPAYWNDAPATASATLTARSELLAMQVKNDPATYHNALEHIHASLIQPFVSAVQYYEAPTWQDTVKDQIAAYEALPMSGWRWPPLVGVLLTMTAFVGASLVGYRGIWQADPAARVLFVAFIAEAIGMLSVPLGWQRYYLPALPILILLVAYVPYAFLSWARHK